MMSGDSCPLEIEEVVQFVFRKGFYGPDEELLYGPDEELLIDAALTFPHPVNLAD